MTGTEPGRADPAESQTDRAGDRHPLFSSDRMTDGSRQHFPTIIHQAGSRHDFTRHTRPETVTPSKQRCTAEHAESITATTQGRPRPGSHRKPDGVHSTIQATHNAHRRPERLHPYDRHISHRNAHREPRRAASDAERHDGHIPRRNAYSTPTRRTERRKHHSIILLYRRDSSGLFIFLQTETHIRPLFFSTNEKQIHPHGLDTGRPLKPTRNQRRPEPSKNPNGTKDGRRPHHPIIRK